MLQSTPYQMIRRPRRPLRRQTLEQFTEQERKRKEAIRIANKRNEERLLAMKKRDEDRNKRHTEEEYKLSAKAQAQDTGEGMPEIKNAPTIKQTPRKSDAAPEAVQPSGRTIGKAEVGKTYAKMKKRKA